MTTGRLLRNRSLYKIGGLENFLFAILLAVCSKGADAHAVGSSSVAQPTPCLAFIRTHDIALWDLGTGNQSNYADANAVCCAVSNKQSEVSFSTVGTYAVVAGFLPAILDNKVAQHWHYWHLGLDNSLLWETVLHMALCLAAPVSIVNARTTSFPSCDNQKWFQMLPNILWKTKLPLLYEVGVLPCEWTKWYFSNVF